MLIGTYSTWCRLAQNLSSYNSFMYRQHSKILHHKYIHHHKHIWKYFIYLQEHYSCHHQIKFHWYNRFKPKSVNILHYKCCNLRYFLPLYQHKTKFGIHYNFLRYSQ